MKNYLVIFGLLTTLICLEVQAQEKVKIYGYLATRLEKVFNEPSVDPATGKTVTETGASEWSFPSLNIMMQNRISDNFKVFVNLSGADAGGVSVQNFWGEYSYSSACNIRLGKTYRKFGLYNEILDAVPTYYGIEPPELFDGDHLIVSRTSILMLHGSMEMGEGFLNYSVSTDDGEGGPSKDLIPMGWDLNYKFGHGSYTVGTSGYWSGGKTTSDKGVGEGSPKTGVLPWMASDDFKVYGGYVEANILDGLTLQAAYWGAAHTAVRDPSATVDMINGASPNDPQMARFLKDTSAAVVDANVNTNGDYDVSTLYVRAGYSIYTDRGEFAPYAQFDWYENPETIKSKKYGGDNEAGFADDGKFTKLTAGIIYRPVMQVAVKLDGSAHIQQFNGNSEFYPEIRFDVSYLFGQ